MVRPFIARLMCCPALLGMHAATCSDEQAVTATERYTQTLLNAVNRHEKHEEPRKIELHLFEHPYCSCCVFMCLLVAIWKFGFQFQ